MRAHYAESIQVHYREDLDPLPNVTQTTILAGWRDLADLAHVPACEHLADPYARPELDDRMRPGIYVCARHSTAGIICPACAVRHLTRPANDHRECPDCGADLDPLDLRPVRVDVAVDLADRDGTPARPFSGVLRTVGWEECQPCHSRRV